MGTIPGDFMDFADIPNQIERAERERIYKFNLMVVGLTEIGKSTLIRCLTQGKVTPKETDHCKLNEYTQLIEENGVRLKFHCIETSKFEQHDPKKYVEYIEEQLKSHFKKQIRNSAWNIEDTRVHCCLYLIPPYNGLKLQKLDLDCMRALQNKVNLVPVIVNSDKMDLKKLAKLKENVMATLKEHDIKYFEFKLNIEDDEDRFYCVKTEAERFPFAVMAADETTMVDGKEKWVRHTLGGPIDIWDNTKSDFSSLAKLVMRHCMLELMDTTHTEHYAEVKRKILDDAKVQNGANLHAMGLNAQEIRRVMKRVNKNHYDPTVSSIHERGKAEVEKLRMELEKMNNVASISKIAV